MDVKKWVVEFSHKDGRNGKVEVTTEVVKSGGFRYGNGKSGALTVAGYTNIYDLRYNSAKDLHIEMLMDYFGKGIVKATEI